LRPVRMTLAPSARARRAVSNPIPALPPMTTTVCPSSSGSRRVDETGVEMVMNSPLVTPPLLVLFAESLDVGFAVGVEEFLAPLGPRGLELGRCNVPVRPALPCDNAQVLAEIFESGPPEEPVTIVNLVNDQTGLQHDHMGDHRIVVRVRIFGDVEIFLDRAPHVGKEGPVRPDAGAIFVRLSDVVRADRNKSAIADLELAMQLDESFGLPTVFGAVASAAEDQNQGVVPAVLKASGVLRCGLLARSRGRPPPEQCHFA
jgi:hypothetical protein